MGIGRSRPGPKTRPRTRVVLTCHHAVEFAATPPMKGELIWCVKCSHMRRVEDAPDEYRVRCRGCSYSRRCGTARLDAETAAARHRKRRPNHRVGIYNGKELIYVMGADAGDDTQPGLWPAHTVPRDPPF